MSGTFGETGLRSLFNGSLDVVRDEPEHRLGNLGLYVRLVGQPPNAQGPGDGRSDRFVVEEDQRQRVRLHWRSREASDNGSSRAAWYVSSAFSPWEPTASVCETLGCEAVDWVWSGLNASILSVGLQADVGHVLFSPPRAAGQGVASHANVKCFTRDGLLGFCMRELCCRIDAVDAARFRLGFSMWELDGDGVKDYFGELQEEAHLPFGPLGVVRFATPEEGLSLWEACQSPVEPQGSHSPSTRGSSREKHVFVRLLLLDTHRRSMAALHFVQMAEWDGTNGETGIGHEAVPGDRLATKSKALQALLRNLSSSSQPKVTSGGLPQALAPLIGGNCKPFLLCTVPEQPGRVFPEVRDLLDVAERASLLITAQCKRVQGLPADAFRLVDASQGLLCRTAARAPRADEGFSLSRPAHSPQRREPTTAFDVPPALRGVPPPPSPQHDLSDVVRFDRPASAGASPVSDARSPSKAESPRPHPVGHSPGAGDVDRDSPAGPVPSQAPAAGESQQAHAELAAAVAALRAKNRAKAERRQRDLANIHAESRAILQEIEGIEDTTEAAPLLQAFRGEVACLRKQVEAMKKANAFLAGLHGEDKRYAAQKEALKMLQQEASQLQASRNALEKGEKRAGLVQRCLEEVHSRLNLAKKRKLEAEQEISRLRPAYSELGRQLDVAATERRWLQGELDKMRQTASGLRTEISQLLEVRGAINALPPQDVSARRKNTGFAGNLERFAALQRRLATAAPHLMPLCTRARTDMEELVQCCQKLEDRQRRLQQVAPQCGVPLLNEADGQVNAEASVASRKGANSSRRAVSSETLDRSGSGGPFGDMLGQQRQSQRLQRSPYSAETLGARSARSSATGTPGAWRPTFASPSASTLGAGLREADRYTMHSDDGQPEQGLESSPSSSCSKRYQDQGSQASLRKRSSGLRSTAGTLQDLGIQVPPGQASYVQVHLAKAKAAVPRATPGWNSARTRVSKS